MDTEKDSWFIEQPNLTFSASKRARSHYLPDKQMFQKKPFLFQNEICTVNLVSNSCSKSSDLVWYLTLLISILIDLF